MNWLPNFKRHTCKLDLPVLYGSHFAVRFLGPKVGKVDFWGRKVNSHSFDGFKSVESTQNKSRKTMFGKPNYNTKIPKYELNSQVQFHGNINARYRLPLI